MKVAFIDLEAQYNEVKKDVLQALKADMKRGDFILGQDTKLFETEFSAYCGSKFGVGVNSGTDALFLTLRAMGIAAGDEVIVPAYTFIATALAVSYTGARPVFVDIDERTYNIDAAKIKAAITPKTKAIIPVHLYGQPADMDAINALAQSRGIKVIEDAAQAHGAEYHGKRTGSLADAACFSFYPTKNLGAFGDGGMILTDDESLYAALLKLRDCGRSSLRYEHVVMGYNSRLDTLQASVLLAKLKRLNAWNAARREHAMFYAKLLGTMRGVVTPACDPDITHAYHLYSVRVANRDAVADSLKENGIGYSIHYPLPLHLQPVYAGLGHAKGDFPISEKVASEIISLPMHPHLKNSQIRHTVKALKKAAAR